MAKYQTNSQKSETKAKVDEALKFFDDKDTMEGFEDITQSTMAIPFVRIAQQLTPQLKKNKPEYIEGLEEGMFFNTITKEVYGNSFQCIVLKFEHVYIEWRPERGGFVGYHTPENAERIAVDHTFGNWKTKEGNLLQENYVYLLLIAGHEKEGVVVFSLSSSMIKTAREWNRLMTTHVMENGKKAMPYYLVWEVSTEYRSNEKGDWYVPVVKYVGYIGEKQYEVAKNERKVLPSRQIDYRQLQAPQGGSSDEIDEEAEDKF